MTVLREGNVVWTFPDGWTATKYDDWTFYRKQFQGKSGGDSKAVDIIAMDHKSNELWLIEAKDYTFERRHPGKEPIWQEVAKKARDTLAGLMAAHVNAPSGDERDVAASAMSATRIRVVLHLELPSTRLRNYGRLVAPVDVLQKLKELVRAIDPHPKVVDATTATKLPWKAEWQPMGGSS